MSKQYSPKHFFRKAPNRFLKQYFTEKNVLSGMIFHKLTETKIEPVYEAWLKLPEDVRRKIERDFQEIDELATEGGVKAILDEANYHEENLAEKFTELDSPHSCAFWTFLTRNKYWGGASAFYHADALPFSYWRRRKNIPCVEAKTDKASINELERKLGNYFHYKQGRGKNCKVDCYKRNDLDYYFAYPEDYSQASIEWEAQEFKRRPHHPAFEIIFVYSQNKGTLDIYLSGDRKPVPDLQEIFANIILQTKLKAADKDERVYNLNQLLSRDFQFIYGIESGIKKVAIKKLRIKIHGKNCRITLEADPSDNKHAVLDLLDEKTKNLHPHQIAVTQVGIKVISMPNLLSEKTKTRTFDISYPNSCSLKQDGRDLIIRKMLKDSNIELQDASDVQ